jgi:hypothetical protein
LEENHHFVDIEVLYIDSKEKVLLKYEEKTKERSHSNRDINKE